MHYYISKILAPDETLIGVARLHWIYVIRGILWFFMLAGTGWVINDLMARVLMSFAGGSFPPALSLSLLQISNGAMYFMVFGGLLVFTLFVLKVLTTEVGLSSRRVFHKEGLLFIKVKQIDLEEIRGERLDLGWFGSILRYGYLLLDCRFVGDIKLPAIENAAVFLSALHDQRGKTQDSLSLVVGKGNAVPLQAEETPKQPETPQPQTPKPAEPEISPPQPDQPPTPEVKPATPAYPEIPSTPIPIPPQPDVPPTAQVQTSINPVIDPAVVQEVVKQVMPQMAHQVAQELVQKGIVDPHAGEKDPQPQTELVEEFDEVAMNDNQSGAYDDPQPKHAIH